MDTPMAPRTRRAIAVAQQSLKAVCRVVGMLAIPALSYGSVNPITYGATPNDGTDDTVAFINALAAIPLAGGELYIPAGTFLLSYSLVTQDKPITIRGEGQRVTILKWTTAGHGLWFLNGASAAINLSFNVQSISLLTTVASANSNAAIVAEFPTVGSGFHGAKGFISANISDVHIGPDQLGSDNWTYGMILRNVTSAKISRFNIIGNQGTASYSAEGGIHIEGRSLGVRITEGEIYGFNYGIRALDAPVEHGIEGISISNVDTTDVNYGIHILSPVYHRPGTWISNCHTASRLRGIYLETQTQVFVENTLNYKLDNQPGWIGIHLLNTRDSKIVNNMSGRVGSGAANGIALHYGAINNIVSGNSSNDLDGHIWIVDTSSYGNFITGNRKVGSGTAIVDGGTPGANPQTNNIL